MLKAVITIIFGILYLTSSVTAQSEAEAIRAMLNERDAEIKELLGPSGSEYTQDQRDDLKDIINDVINYRAMAQVALGNTYNEISTEDRDEFVSLFATIIRDNSLNRLDIYRAEVTYTDIIVEGDRAIIKTIAELESVRTSVDYEMRRFNNNWMITDMTIDDVSTAQSYNRQFQSIIRQRGFDALLQSLQRRAARAAS